jgi:hypothetical protein
LQAEAQAGDESAGAAGLDHVGREGLDDLSERQVNRGGIFGRRQEELEALVEGAGLGHAHEASAMAEMIETELASSHGGGATLVSVVVEVGAKGECRHVFLSGEQLAASS